MAFGHLAVEVAVPTMNALVVGAICPAEVKLGKFGHVGLPFRPVQLFDAATDVRADFSPPAEQRRIIVDAGAHDAALATQNLQEFAS